MEYTGCIKVIIKFGLDKQKRYLRSEGRKSASAKRPTSSTIGMKATPASEYEPSHYLANYCIHTNV